MLNWLEGFAGNILILFLSVPMPWRCGLFLALIAILVRLLYWITWDKGYKAIGHVIYIILSFLCLTLCFPVMITVCVFLLSIEFVLKGWIPIEHGAVSCIRAKNAKPPLLMFSIGNFSQNLLVRINDLLYLINKVCKRIVQKITISVHKIFPAPKERIRQAETKEEAKKRYEAQKHAQLLLKVRAGIQVTILTLLFAFPTLFSSSGEWFKDSNPELAKILDKQSRQFFARWYDVERQIRIANEKLFVLKDQLNYVESSSVYLYGYPIDSPQLAANNSKRDIGKSGIIALLPRGTKVMFLGNDQKKHWTKVRVIALEGWLHSSNMASNSNKK